MGELILEFADALDQLFVVVLFVAAFVLIAVPCLMQIPNLKGEDE